jgi:hypothetical protein
MRLTPCNWSDDPNDVRAHHKKFTAIGRMERQNAGRHEAREHLTVKSASAARHGRACG